VGEPFEGVARSSIVDACFELQDTFDKVHDLDETSLEESHDVLIHEESPSRGFDDCVFLNPLDHTHVSPMCSLPSPSPEYDIVELIDNSTICNANNDLGYEDNMFSMLGGNFDDFVSLGCSSRFNASIDPYCICLEIYLGKSH